MQCIFGQCENDADGVVVVQDERNDFTVIMAPMCRGHSQKAHEGFSLKIAPGNNIEMASIDAAKAHDVVLFFQEGS